MWNIYIKFYGKNKKKIILIKNIYLIHIKPFLHYKNLTTNPSFSIHIGD
jgi:hypothetical protein